MKKIPQRYFEELIKRGDTVPRRLDNGEVMNGFLVSKNYEITASETGERALVRCTQDCPTNLRLIEKLK